ncbi:MAG: hypothetical protein ACOYMN_17045 [Roseimicrobium sp.]
MRNTCALLALFALSALLSSCNTIHVAPGAPAPRIALNAATGVERRFIPKLEHYFRRSGFQVVQGGPAEYELDFNISEHRLGVGVQMSLYENGRLISTGEGRAAGHIRYANRDSVADEAFNEALDELSPPTVTY